MGIEDIRAALRKRTVIFTTGGRRPTMNEDESWIGRIGFRSPGETVPLDADGEAMQPLVMFSLAGLPWVPEPLAGKRLLSIFISPNIYRHLAEEGYEGYCAVRAYGPDDALEPCDWVGDFAKPFPLTPVCVEDDYPVWEDCNAFGGVSFELEDGTFADYYKDIKNTDYSGHKLGGYPSYCQGAVDFGEEFGFVVQISTDPKADLYIVDDGSFYFFLNAKTGEWKAYCDFM